MMDKQEHQICELMEDCADIYKRLQAVAHTVDRVGVINARILKENRDENRRLRIAHLRRMADAAEDWGEYMIEENGEYTSLHPLYEKAVYDGRRLIRFADACRAEIARLRAEA